MGLAWLDLPIFPEKPEILSLKHEFKSPDLKISVVKSFIKIALGGKNKALFGCGPPVFNFWFTASFPSPLMYSSCCGRQALRPFGPAWVPDITGVASQGPDLPSCLTPTGPEELGEVDTLKSLVIQGREAAGG